MSVCSLPFLPLPLFPLSLSHLGMARNGLLAELVDLIKVRGPMSMAEYIKIAMTHPRHGYYAQQQGMEEGRPSRAPTAH